MWRVDAILHSYAKKRASQVFIDKNSINHIAFPTTRTPSTPASAGETKRAERATLLLIEATTSEAAVASDIHVPLIYDPASRLFGDFLPAINVRHVAAAAASLI